MTDPTDLQGLPDKVQELRAEIRDLKKYVGRAIGAQADTTDQKIAEAARKLTEAHEQTTRELTAARQKTAKLEEDLKKADQRTEDRLDSLGRRLDKLDARLDSLAGTAETTQRELELLNRKVRQIEAPGSRAEIDTWAAGQAELAAQAAEGREAACRLRGMADPETLRARITAHEQNIADHRHHRDQAIDAARHLADLHPADPEAVWTQHMRAWTRHQQAATDLAGRLAESAADAAKAQAELAVHAQRMSELLPAIEQGEIAERRLRERIRGYLETVVAADQFLPTWLEVRLGPGIPRKHWREWMDTAVDVVLYRLVHRIPSLVDALGERPAEAGDRQAEYDRLTEDCAQYRL